MTTDQQILDALGYLQLAHPWCPTLGELATAVGMSARSSTLPYLHRLRDAGLVDWRPAEPRTLHLTWAGWDASCHPDGPQVVAHVEMELAHCRAMLADCADQLRPHLRQPATCPGPASPQTAHDPRTSTCPECAPDWYLLVCRHCDPELATPMPFPTPAERGRWATEHRHATGHTSYLVLDKPRPPRPQV